MRGWRPKWTTVTMIVALIGVLVVAAPVFGLSKNIKKAIKKEVSKQIAENPGPAGPAGPAGATNVVMRQGPAVNVTAGNAARIVANCLPGERATGGGVFNEAQVGTLVVTSSYPLPNPGSPPPTGDGQVPTGWNVWMKSTAGVDHVVNGYVICAAP